ncbi:predicted protein [Nematostella vectensis]|uniref:Uncharacterized protein n=1 Tax=Nematostella vectensis TaxID=45351 RepID=A7RW23_NEMVE|nr:predicted protein [Nematostella vectensis]|eukprot:XP_001636399.1 predicted protein [Nematostella vectensis]
MELGVFVALFGSFFLITSFHLSQAAFSSCSEFPVIPEGSYDMSSDSYNDYSKRPLGFMHASAQDPTVSTNVPNPCASLTNLTNKAVEVLVETVVRGKQVCVESDDGKVACGMDTINLCKEATKDTMKYEFYCDPAKGCAGSVSFWYRLRPSEGDPDMWCLNSRQVAYPSSLLPVPTKLPTKMTTASTAQVIRLSSLTQGCALVLLLYALMGVMN